MKMAAFRTRFYFSPLHFHALLGPFSWPLRDALQADHQMKREVLSEMRTERNSIFQNVEELQAELLEVTAELKEVATKAIKVADGLVCDAHVTNGYRMIYIDTILLLII